MQDMQMEIQSDKKYGPPLLHNSAYETYCITTEYDKYAEYGRQIICRKRFQ
jgi:hypothetical protein